MGIPKRKLEYRSFLHVFFKYILYHHSSIRTFSLMIRQLWFPAEIVFSLLTSQNDQSLESMSESLIYYLWLVNRWYTVFSGTTEQWYCLPPSVRYLLIVLLCRSQRNPSISKKLLESEVLRSSTLHHSVIENEVFSPVEVESSRNYSFC